MKKLSYAVAILAILGMSSCGKSFTCICYDSNGTQTTSTVKGTGSNATAQLLNADSKCTAKNTSTLTCGI